MSEPSQPTDLFARFLDSEVEVSDLRLAPRQVVWLVVGASGMAAVLFAAGFWLGRQHAPPGSVVFELPQVAALPGAPTPDSELSPSGKGDTRFHFPSLLSARPGRTQASARPLRLEPDVFEPPLRAAESPGAATAVARAEPTRPDLPRVAAPPSRVAEETRSVRLTAPETDREPAPAADRVAARGATGDVPVPESAPRPTRTRPLTLEVASVGSKKEASERVAALRRAGFKSTVIVTTIPGEGRSYRVRVGQFDSPEAALAMRAELSLRGATARPAEITDL